jgi:hypothetical protein
MAQFDQASPHTSKFLSHKCHFIHNAYQIMQCTALWDIASFSSSRWCLWQCCCHSWGLWTKHLWHWEAHLWGLASIMRLYTCSNWSTRFFRSEASLEAHAQASTCSASKASKQIEAPWLKLLSSLQKKSCVQGGKKSLRHDHTIWALQTTSTLALHNMPSLGSQCPPAKSTKQKKNKERRRRQ